MNVMFLKSATFSLQSNFYKISILKFGDKLSSSHLITKKHKIQLTIIHINPQHNFQVQIYKPCAEFYTKMSMYKIGTDNLIYTTSDW